MRIEERLKVIYETIAPAVTRSESAWKEYLRFGSQVYKHQFDNALLVYAQSPKSTMLATTPIWNKVGRYINKGEKGIAVCEYDNAKATIKFLFDIAQTNGKAAPDIWLLDEEKAKALSDRLAYSYNLTASDLSDCIGQIVSNTLANSIDDYLQDFETDIKDHFLGSLPQDGLIDELSETIESSCRYFISHRCGISTDEPIMPTISHFDTIPLVARLGYTVTEISKGILLEIERNVKIIENERRNQNEQRNYEQPDTARAFERSANTADRGRTTSRQVRQNGDELPATKQPPKIFTFEDARRANGENAVDRRASEEQGGGNHAEAPTQRPDAADGRYSGENPTPEQAERHSGGNRAERIGVDTEITPPTTEQPKNESLDSGSFLLPQEQFNWQDRVAYGDRVSRVPIDNNISFNENLVAVSNWLKEAAQKPYLPTYAIMYHGTSKDFPILDEGIYKSLGGTNSPNSEKGFVYLTTEPNIAKNFADKFYDYNSVVYEVVVPLKNLLPDDEQLESVSYEGNKLVASLVQTGCAKIAGHIEPWQVKEYIFENEIATASETSQQAPAFQGTPLWVQYQALTSEYPDSIIFKQLGDFYEVMGEKVQLVSDELTLVIASRDVGLAERVPMIGVPFHTLDKYTDELLSRGYDVVKVDTDGTVTDKKALEAQSIPDEEESLDGYAIPDEQTQYNAHSDSISDDEAILKLSDHIHLEGRDFEVTSIDYDRNQIKLLDLEFIRRGQVPISRVEDLDYVLQHYEQIPNNEFTAPVEAPANAQLSIFDTTTPTENTEEVDPYLDAANYTEPFVVIEWSESENFTDNERLNFREADLKFKEIEKQERQETIERFGKLLGYNKTWGKVYYLDDEQDTELSTYEFRYDIGDYGEDTSGLFNHITSFWDYVENKNNNNEFSGYDGDSVTNVKKMLEILTPYRDTTFIPFADKVDEQSEALDGSGGMITLPPVTPKQIAPFEVGTRIHYDKRVYEIVEYMSDGKTVVLGDVEQLKNFNSFFVTERVPISRIENAKIAEQNVAPTTAETKTRQPKPLPETPKPLPKLNYHYSETDNLYSGGAKTKFKANIEAIRLLKRLESEKRLATPDEQKVLANYVGWGGLANAFSDTASGWENEYQELKLLLDEDEYKAARNSTITAYYTEPKLIEYMYKALDNFGFVGGEGRKILDPAMGTGNFFSVLPEVLQDTNLYGVELDSITGRIAKQLYQKANISVQGFETTRFEDNSFDVAIGNIPFNNIKLFDKRYEEQDFLIHDYFIAKSIDLVKPGGIVAYITTKGTMDKNDTSVREYIARRADLIGAIRLPNTAFKQLAGTEVTADILFLQKKENPNLLGDKFSLPDWVFTNARKTDYLRLNQYFIDNPEMVLGEMKFSRNMYGREDGTACVAPDGQDLYAELDRAISNLNATFSAEPDKPKVVASHGEMITDEEEKRIKAPEGTKNCTYVVRDDSIFYCENGYLIPQDIKGKKAERIKGLCEVKTALIDVVDIQSREYQSFELNNAQLKLNDVYDAFVKKNGYINSKANIAAFSDDDQFPLLRSIEDENDDKETYSKAPIFTRATIKSYRQPTHADSAKEALEISLNMKMKVDLAYMSHLYEKSEDEIIAELGDRIYLNPQKYYGNPYEGWETAEEYLSGEVVDKLNYARLKAQDNEIFSRNVEALQAVQPPQLMPSDIEYRIGSPWIPIEYFKQFMYETFETPDYFRDDTINIDYMEYTTQWHITSKNSDRSIKVNQTYGTSRMNAYDIYEDCLNQQSATVRDRVDYVDANGKDQVKYVVNPTETMIARAKQQQIKEAFGNWLFKDKDRTEVLLKIYNETFNTIRPREYDGSHLVFPNMNEERELRQHQKDVAARIIYNGTCLMAHEVGAGKTAAMIAAGMYMKNIGAIKKPIYVVPNHLTDQWATEFLRFFPSANVLVTSKKDFEKHNRKKFVSKIAMGEYDAIIIGHSQFEKIPISKERQEKQLNEEISSLTYIIDQMKRQKGENWAIKQIVIFQNNLKNRLEKLIKEERKDDLLDFEQLGVDYMFVDEAHVYKNCFTYSKMRNVAGIGQSSSQRASDMLMKCQYLQEINNGKGVTFATGTPISNSMSEMFVMQRYLQPQALKKRGLHYFDSWAATFGEVVSSLEITPEGNGYRIKNRFAKFHNLPELMKMFKLIADIQTSDMLNLPVPEIEGGKPTIVSTECSEFQKLIMQSFVERADAIRKREVKPEEDNMLKLTNEAKLMAIDPRLVYPDAPVDPDSKLNTCINNVYDVWQETAEKRLTQVIFCDSGTPKPGQFNVYDETKQQLIAKGIPENEIAFIHDAKTDSQRDDMFDKMRKGEIRVLLGSTSKLGTGTNIQNKMIALHHLDVPWRPSDIIQRDGRGIRQYNENPVIKICRYVTKGTFDAYLWQIQEQKLRYITQIMTSKSISRSCEDTDETVLTAAEVKAIATSNPLLAEKMEVDNEVTRLKLLRGNWNNEKLTNERNINSHYPTLISTLEKRIYDVKSDIALLEQFKSDDFKMVIDGKAYDERPQAGDAFVTVMKAKCEIGSRAEEIGEYCGLQVLVERKNLADSEIRIKGNGSYSAPMGESALGCITRIENLAGKLPTFLSEAEQKLTSTKSQLEEAKIIVLQPFQFEEKLNDYVARQSDINAKLEFKQLSEQNGDIMDENNTDESEVKSKTLEYDEEYEEESDYAV